MKIPEINSEFVIARHHQGVKLVRPESHKAAMMGIMSVADCMTSNLHVYFTDYSQIMRDMNDVCARNVGAISKHDLLGYTIEKISSDELSINKIEGNNRDVMHQRCLKVFDEPTTLRNGGGFRALSIKQPWYDDDDKIVGIFGASIPVFDENITELPALFAATMNRFSLPECQGQPAQQGTSVGLFSSREHEILGWIVRGKTMREISELIGLSRRTIESYFENIKNKLGVKTRSQVVNLVIDYFI